MKPFALFLLACAWPCIPIAAEAGGSRVGFNGEGIALIDGEPFFPIGMFTYELNPEVLAELRELQCNTVLHGFQVDQLDLLHDHGLMAICDATEPWVEAAVAHPALLAWYLSDEPENRGTTPEQERQRYVELKARDPHHPIGLCHTSFEALTQYRAACDFTMTDIYPITAQRDANIMGVSIMMDEARRIHGAAWPQWTYIQTFGGPEADQGVWAPPLPHEVRFMAYQALVHRATGILYFSYWPQQPRTWQSIAALNGELQRLAPRLVAPGRDGALQADHPSIEARFRIDGAGSDAAGEVSALPPSGLIIAINTSPRFVHAAIKLPWPLEGVEAPFEGRMARPSPAGELVERFAPYGVHVYTWGPEPTVRLARQPRP